MKLLYVTPECLKFASAGGVGVVAYYLLVALAAVVPDLEIEMVMPLHAGISPDLIPAEPEKVFRVRFRGHLHEVRVFRSRIAGTKVTVWLVENKSFFGNGKIYQHDE